MAELKVLKKALEEKQKALANAKIDAENLRNMNKQLKKVGQKMREKVNLVQEEKTILKDDLRKLIGELDQAVSSRYKFNKYGNIFMQIMDKVKKNSEKQSAVMKTTQAEEHDYARRVDSKPSASSSNVNNNAPDSKKRQSSEPDEGQNKIARNSQNKKNVDV